MDFSKLKLFSMMQTKMQYLGERQSVLAQNIANADTPGYKAKDLKPLEFDDMVSVPTRRIRMHATEGTHLQRAEKLNDYRSVKQREPYEQSPTNNHVVIEEQMMKMAETKMDYQMISNLYKKTTDLFKASLGER